MKVKEMLIDALKEGGRVFIVAALPILISQVQNDNFDIRLVYLAGFAAILRALDSWVHDYLKSEDKEGSWKGLIGF